MNPNFHQYFQSQKKNVIRRLINRLKNSEQVRANFPAALLPEFLRHIWEHLQGAFEKDNAADPPSKLQQFFVNHAYLRTTLREMHLILNATKHEIKTDLWQIAIELADAQKIELMLDQAFDNLGLIIIDACSKSPVGAAGVTSANDRQPPSRLNLFYNAFQGSTDGIILTDLDARIIDVNGAFLEIYGYSYDEVIGQRTAILRSGKTTDAIYEKMWNEIKLTGNWAGQIINRHKSGDEIPVWLSITSITERDKTVGYMGVEFDMRKQQELERRIIQSERLAIIGQMAAKVAHEVRNPLSSISLNAELLGDELRYTAEGISTEGETLLKAIMDEVERVTNLTEDYLQFSRLPEADFHLVSLDELLLTTIEFVEPEANSQSIEIIREIEANLPKVAADVQQIRRVVLNLMRNAFDAMKSGGILRLHAVSAGENVEISIADNGDGIPLDEQKKIFEPFFTTKDMGTGLGLAIAMQIVQEHRGRISFTSKVGGGTVFTVVLPIQHKMLHQKEESA